MSTTTTSQSTSCLPENAAACVAAAAATTGPPTAATTRRAAATCGAPTAGASAWASSRSGAERPSTLLHQPPPTPLESLIVALTWPAVMSSSARGGGLRLTPFSCFFCSRINLSKFVAAIH